MTKSEKRQEWARAAELMHELPKATSKQVDELLSLAGRLHRYFETECNYGLTQNQATRVENLEVRILRICKALGIKAKFNGDPRGFAVKLLLPSGRYNTWGGTEEGWGI